MKLEKEMYLAGMMLTQAASLSLIMLPASFLPTGEKTFNGAKGKRLCYQHRKQLL